MLPHQDLLRLAGLAAERAAAYVRGAERPRDPAGWTRKGISDYVTSIDREAERLIAETLLAGAPGSAVRGEELSPDGLDAELTWVVDPLDGTTNYLHDYQSYAVSIAAVAGGAPLAGVVLDISRGTLFRASAGGGAWHGTDRLKVSAITDPAVALIGTGFPFRTPDSIPRYLRQFTAIMRATSGIRRAGAASLDLVDVALGRLEGFWELYLAPWDVAAGTLIIREAGGTVTNLDGSPDVVAHGPIVAGNPEIHAWLAQLLRET